MRFTRSATAIFAAGLVLAVAGCSHKSTQAVVVPPQAQAPTQEGGSTTQQPLYTPPEPAPAPAATPAPAPAPEPVYTEPVPVAKPKRKKKPSPATPVTPASGSTATATATPAATPEASPAATEKPSPAVAEDAPHKAADSPEVAAAAPAEGESPIGQLTAGDANSSPEQRRGTMDLIATNERRLRSLPRSLSADEQHTVALVRKFQQQARQALSGQDLQAAKTLATKAKLLLDELQK